MTADVLRSGGTKAKTGDQIDEELENIAASVESSMDETSASMSFSGLKETTDRCWRLQGRDDRSPSSARTRSIWRSRRCAARIARRNDDASGIPERELASILYGRNTPYGWQVEYADLDRIHRDDLMQFYHRYYFPKNIMLAVYGDFSDRRDEGQAGENCSPIGRWSSRRCRSFPR